MSRTRVIVFGKHNLLTKRVVNIIRGLGDRTDEVEIDKEVKNHDLATWCITIDKNRETLDQRVECMDQKFNCILVVIDDAEGESDIIYTAMRIFSGADKNLILLRPRNASVTGKSICSAKSNSVKIEPVAELHIDTNRDSFAACLYKHVIDFSVKRHPLGLNIYKEHRRAQRKAHCCCAFFTRTSKQ